ncbi:MAG: efflux RND transporter periplasmic adaptor subunit [Halobacteria archaeon]|nr:efflux RND transporter periplasmic adaptor subunit [Halobacteria archaeon]
MLASRLVLPTVLVIAGIAIGIALDRHWLTQGDANRPISESETALEHAREHADPDYVCPMHADVVSKDPGSCPVCGMDLVERKPIPAENALEHARRHLDPDYVCPMHPDVVSKESGSCPVCGMYLVEREPVMQAAQAGEMMPAVTVTPAFIHNFGVRTATVERGSVSRRIVAIGRVSRMPLPKENDALPGLPGTVAELSDKGIGDPVEKGEWLYSVDAPAWRSLQQAYLDAIEAEDEVQRKQLRQRLQSLGMDNATLSQLERGGRIRQMFDITAPVKGTINEWRAAAGDTVDTGTRVVTLGGVNRVPVIISLFEGQGAWIDRGQRVVFRVPTMPGTEFVGTVDRTDREINFSTRTLPVYAGFFTSDPRLRYGMLVETEIHTSDRENVLRIPREALIRTGEGDRVIVALGDGRFQPVTVVTGIESGEYMEVLSGLEEGDRVVVSGQFLIDSESSLTANFQRMEMGTGQ